MSTEVSRNIQIKLALTGEFQYIFPVFKHCSNGCIEIYVECKESDLEKCLENMLHTLKNFSLKLHEVSEPVHQFLEKASPKFSGIVRSFLSKIRKDILDILHKRVP